MDTGMAPDMYRCGKAPFAEHSSCNVVRGAYHDPLRGFESGSE